MDTAGDWNMKNDAIGVFDSGIGGLTAVKALRALMPNENIIYFGDTARIPYGSRSRETVLKYANEDISFLRKFPIKMIIAACGTVSTILGTKSPVTDMPFTGVLLPSVQAACGATRNGRIGVIGCDGFVSLAICGVCFGKRGAVEQSVDGKLCIGNGHGV